MRRGNEILAPRSGRYYSLNGKREETRIGETADREYERGESPLAKASGALVFGAVVLLVLGATVYLSTGSSSDANEQATATRLKGSAASMQVFRNPRPPPPPPSPPYVAPPDPPPSPES